VSDPKRYSIFNPQEQENPNGAWVHYYDYARLKAELEMLKASSRGHSTSHLYQQMAEDCVRLKEEVDKLHARWLQMLDENKDLRQTNGQYHQALSENRNLEAENARLKAEVERLTEAGDEMAVCFNCPTCAKNWNDAKKGGQS